MFPIPEEAPAEIARLYGFPADLDGSGEKIALIELGGGFRAADLRTYFRELGLRAPKVTAVSVAGQPNSPSTPDSADGEVVLDIEVAGAVAHAYLRSSSRESGLCDDLVLVPNASRATVQGSADEIGRAHV